MMRKLVFLSLIILAHTALAQQVVQLMRDNSLKTYVTLPFRLEDTDHTALPIFNIELVSGKDTCQAMIDPKISWNFLVKCTQASSVSLNVYFQYGGSMRKIVYGAFNVDTIGSVVESKPPVADYSAGRLLFQANCIECHRNPAEKANKSFTNIKSAIATITEMKKIKLSDTDIKSIVAYLGHL
jgi:hypothetical protein